MESKLDCTVNCLQVVDCTLDAAKENEEPQDRPPKQQEEAYIQAYLYIKTKYKHPKMTNSTSTDVTFGGGWCNRMITKQQDYHSTTPAAKQINE